MITLIALLTIQTVAGQSDHPRIYTSAAEKSSFLERMEDSKRTRDMVANLQAEVTPYVQRHTEDPNWILSRMQMYWNTKYTNVYVNGMDYSHGDGKAPVPTVRFSGSRDWATDYLQPTLDSVLPYMDDPRGLFLQNGSKSNHPWEWTPASETGHIIEHINEEILHLAADAAFLYWLWQDEKYARFASDILSQYMEGMYYRSPPTTVGDDKNAKLMGLQTFEVIHERIIEPVTIAYDFLFDFLQSSGKDMSLFASVIKRWADQEIKFGVPHNNWNLMQARYITYLALALEEDDSYADGQGQNYYLDAMLNQNSEKQKAFTDVLDIYDQETAIWPEPASYSGGVCEDMMEIVCLIDRVNNNRPLEQYPLLEKSVLATFQYLFPNGHTVAFGDAKHRPLRFGSLELLLSQYRKYNLSEKEDLITFQIQSFINSGLYDRTRIRSLFDLFLFVDKLSDPPFSNDPLEIYSSTFYAPNVSWFVQRNGFDQKEGMMVSENASMGNHSHANGINIELFAKGIVFAPDAAAGVSYWSRDHKEYYSRYPSHNTVIVNGKSNYGTMMSAYSFDLKAHYPKYNMVHTDPGPYTFSNVAFTEPSTAAEQTRLVGTIRTGPQSGYFVDIFRSKTNGDQKHEYLFHSMGAPIRLSDIDNQQLAMITSSELSSSNGDLVGFDYFKTKEEVEHTVDFKAHFEMPTLQDNPLQVILTMRGYPDRMIFTAMAPPSRAISKTSVPSELLGAPSPTLIVRQNGEAHSRPFVSIIEAFDQAEGSSIQDIRFFEPANANAAFVGIKITSMSGQIDYLFNNENGHITLSYENHEFQGTYGVVSEKDSQSFNLFLGEGKLLTFDHWQVRSVETNSVMIRKSQTGLKLFASKPFELTVPVSEINHSNKIRVHQTDGTSQSISGISSTRDGIKMMTFHLPKMNHSRATFQ